MCTVSVVFLKDREKCKQRLSMKEVTAKKVSARGDTEGSCDNGGGRSEETTEITFSEAF